MKGNLEMSHCKKSVIIGAGSYGQVYLSYLQQSGIHVVGFLDDDPTLENQHICSLPVLGNVGYLPLLKNHGITDVYCPIGNNKIRSEILSHAQKMGFATPNYIHPTVNISPKVEIGNGCYILLGTNIMPFTKIENFTMISMGVNIAHHSVLKKGTFISAGVTFGSSITAENYTYCGMGSTIMTGVSTLGTDCLIGAGAVVIRNVPPKAIVAGIPAKIIKYKS